MRTQCLLQFSYARHRKMRILISSFIILNSLCFVYAQDADFTEIEAFSFTTLNLNTTDNNIPQADFHLDEEWRSCSTSQSSYFFDASILNDMLFHAFYYQVPLESEETIFMTPTLSFADVPKSYRAHFGKTLEFSEPTIVSNCPDGYELTVENVIEQGDFEHTTVHMRIWTVTDFCGNMDFCTQTIYVIEEPPTATNQIVVKK